MAFDHHVACIASVFGNECNTASETVFDVVAHELSTTTGFAPPTASEDKPDGPKVAGGYELVWPCPRLPVVVQLDSFDVRQLTHELAQVRRVNEVSGFASLLPLTSAQAVVQGDHGVPRC